MKPDLNLLVVLDAVMRHGSVARAAQELSLSQPAVSHALNRLRRVTADALFLRQGRGLVPTPRAVEMADQTTRLVEEARLLLSPNSFDPAIGAAELRIGTSDYAAITLLPGLVADLQTTAPGIRLTACPAGPETLADLAKGRLDLSFWGTDPPKPPFQYNPLFREDYLGVVRADHPILAAERTVSLSDYLRHDHVVVSITAPGGHAIDRALHALSLRRQIALESHSFSGNLAVLRVSDLIASLPRRLCRSLDAGFGTFALPFAVPDYPYGLVWHPRTERAAAHLWLRNRIISLFHRPQDSLTACR